MKRSNRRCHLCEKNTQLVRSLKKAEKEWRNGKLITWQEIAHCPNCGYRHRIAVAERKGQIDLPIL